MGILIIFSKFSTSIYILVPTTELMHYSKLSGNNNFFTFYCSSFNTCCTFYRSHQEGLRSFSIAGLTIGTIQEVGSTNEKRRGTEICEATCTMHVEAQATRKGHQGELGIWRNKLFSEYHYSYLNSVFFVLALETPSLSIY